jgi:hypothetical protein
MMGPGESPGADDDWDDGDGGGIRWRCDGNHWRMEDRSGRLEAGQSGDTRDSPSRLATWDWMTTHR